MTTSLSFLESRHIDAARTRIAARVLDAASSGQLAIVGSALLPRKCLAGVRRAGGEVRAFIEYDPRYWGRMVDGVPVLPPKGAFQMMGKDAVVVSGVWSPHHRYADTRDWIASFGFETIYPVAAIFWAIPDEVGEHYQLGPPDVFAARREDAETVLSRLGDEESRRQFIGNLKWRVTLDPTHIPLPDRRHVYFDPALFQLGDEAVVVDVGAFDGDSLRSFLLWQGHAFARFHALEPDPVSFSRLSQYVAGLPADLRNKIEAMQIAAGPQAGTVKFTATGTPGSGGVQADAETIEVRCVRLADHFGASGVDYLKFDIEGAEWGALEGAWPVISDQRPVVVVAAYHRPTDLIDLPLALMGRLRDASFFFRSHDDDGIDFAFYAVPSERRSKGPT